MIDAFDSYDEKERIRFEPERAPLVGLVLFWLFVAILGIAASVLT